MAKKSMLVKEKKKKDIYNQYSEKRNTLLLQRSNKNISLEERMEVNLAINRLPRNASKSRQRNRCMISGRPRGYYRKLGTSRILLRSMALSGLVTGMRKSSW